MLNKIKILILISILIFPISVFAQRLDTLAVVRIENILLVQPDTLQFDIRLYRNSDRWSRWANGTFQLTLGDGRTTIDENNAIIEYLSGTSQLKVFPITGQLTKDSYFISPRIIKDRISISVLGPELFQDANYIPPDTGLLIGTFRIIEKGGNLLPLNISWLYPQFYYQACAYKLENDSIVPPFITWNTANDNIEMEDVHRTTTVRYEADRPPDPFVKLKYFYARYEGQRKVGLYWETDTEFLNRGFILRRGYLPFGSRDTAGVDFKDFVASFEGGEGKPPVPEMIGMGSSRLGKPYKYQHDTVPFRGETYCYALYYKDFYGREHYLATSCVKIPNSVIVYAQANPNPMTTSTTIEYQLDDDVLLECTVYDLMGKKVKRLIDLQEIKLGKHEVVFEAPREHFASQGMYEVIFIAHPIDDPAVDISKAVVKVQLIR